MDRSGKRIAEEGRYLGFQLATETYAVPIRSVSEIIGLADITHVPNMPDYMKGIINLRGRVLPIMDLRKKFSLPKVDYTRETCIIIVELWSKKIGLIVDTVREVIDFKAKQIELPPDIAGHGNTQCFIGIGKLTDRVVILVEPSLILRPEEVADHASISSVA